MHEAFNAIAAVLKISGSFSNQKLYMPLSINNQLCTYSMCRYLINKPNEN